MNDRVIKFRAWHKILKIMSPVLRIDSRSGVILGDHQTAYFLPFEKVELMQFTSLLDKNGKEIYEGDIIRGEFLDGLLGVNVGSVAFEEGQFVFKCPRAIQYPNDPLWFPVSQLVETEIIGNIFENPELLEKP